MKKRLQRSKNKMIGGVCAGFANYLNMDVTLMRIIWAFLFGLGTIGFWGYLICWIIMPEEA